MQITKGKILSLLVGLGYIVAIIFNDHGVSGNVFKCLAALLLPLAFIWFPDELGNYTGFSGFFGARNSIDSVTPPILISFVGWFFLVGFPILFYFANKYA